MRGETGGILSKLEERVNRSFLQRAASSGSSFCRLQNRPGPAVLVLLHVDQRLARLDDIETMVIIPDFKDTLLVGLFILPLCFHERRDRLHGGRRIRVDREVAALDPAHRHERSYTDDLLNIAPGDDTVIAPCDAEHRSRTSPQKFSRIDVQQRPNACCYYVGGHTFPDLRRIQAKLSGRPPLIC